MGGKHHLKPRSLSGPRHWNNNPLWQRYVFETDLKTKETKQDDERMQRNNFAVGNVVFSDMGIEVVGKMLPLEGEK